MLNENVYTTDAELVRRMQQDDHAAFHLLYKRYVFRIANLAFKFVQQEDAVSELVQDVFVQLYVKRMQVDPEDNISGYLYALMKHKALNAKRNELLHQQHHNIIKAASDEINVVSAEDELEAKQLQQRIQQTIKKLPEKCREVFVLSRYEHLSHHEIATRLNISVKTVEKHIGKALQILRDDLKQTEWCLLIVMLTIY